MKVASIAIALGLFVLTVPVSAQAHCATIGAGADHPVGTYCPREVQRYYREQMPVRREHSYEWRRQGEYQERHWHEERHYGSNDQMPAPVAAIFGLALRIILDQSERR